MLIQINFKPSRSGLFWLKQFVIADKYTHEPKNQSVSKKIVLTGIARPYTLTEYSLRESGR